ncbi:MAG: hypothetical protein M3256_21560 [Actinomycetota bacterium]|nr:hypothetical protein [Actinomycetota bacterium]
MAHPALDPGRSGQVAVRVIIDAGGRSAPVPPGWAPGADAWIGWRAAGSGDATSGQDGQ